MTDKTGDTSQYTQKMQRRLRDTITELRADIEKTDEPQMKALFETSSEVLEGLVKACQHYEQKSEAAWR